MTGGKFKTWLKVFRVLCELQPDWSFLFCVFSCSNEGALPTRRQQIWYVFFFFFQECKLQLVPLITINQGGRRWSEINICFLKISPPSAADDDSWPDVICKYPNQPIHLWQFLRELLLKPNNYSRFIRWVNKEKGEAESVDSLCQQISEWIAITLTGALD